MLLRGLCQPLQRGAASLVAFFGCVLRRFGPLGLGIQRAGFRGDHRGAELSPVLDQHLHPLFAPLTPDGVRVNDVVVAVETGDLEVMLGQRAGDLAGLVPVRCPGIEVNIGKAGFEHDGVEAIVRHAPRRFLQRQLGIDASEDAQLQVLLGSGAQVRSGVAEEGQADRGGTREL